MPTFDLLIFDFDGTLADTAERFREILSELARKFGFRQVDDAELEALRSCPTREVVRRLGVPTWKLPLLARHARQLGEKHADQVKLFPEVPGLLERLDRAGVQLAVVSSGSERAVRRVLERHGVESLRHLACGAGLFGKARKFRRVLRRTGVAPGRALSIGDESRDLEAARATGVAAGAVAWGYADRELLESLGPDFLFEKLQEIETAVIPGSGET